MKNDAPKLADLLKRWAELQPDRCMFSKKGRCFIKRRNRFRHVSHLTPTDEDLIQGAACEALEATKKGDWIVHSMGLRRYNAAIEDDQSWGLDETGKTPVEAVLKLLLNVIDVQSKTSS